MDVNTHTSSASRRRSHRENAKSAKTNQRKITTASSTATMTRKADPYGSWDGRQKGKPKGRGEFGGSCSNCREMVTEAETAGVKGAKDRDIERLRQLHQQLQPLQQQPQGRRQIRERVRFTIICTSAAACASEPW